MHTLRLTLFGALLGASLIYSGCASPKASSSAITAVNTAPEPASNEPAEHADLSGDWQYTMTSDQQDDITGVLTIQRGGNAGYTGRISTSSVNSTSETNITRAQLTGSNFIYEGVVKSPQGDIPFALTGTIRGNRMEGKNAVQYRGQQILYKVIATRR